MANVVLEPGAAKGFAALPICIRGRIQQLLMRLER